MIRSADVRATVVLTNKQSMPSLLLFEPTHASFNHKAPIVKVAVKVTLNVRVAPTGMCKPVVHEIVGGYVPLLHNHKAGCVVNARPMASDPANPGLAPRMVSVRSPPRDTPGPSLRTVIV